jgi:hypothetical protein
MKDVILGMLAPVVVTGLSWVLTERTYRRDPQAVTTWMITAFGAKLLVFAAYVALALKVLAVEATPFVTSFVGSFLVLHLAEAFALKRLFSGGLRESR